jgi:PiT family inorganic phosphate transporter
LRLICRVKKELCICVGTEERIVAVPEPASILALRTTRVVTLTVDQEENCRERYAGSMLGLTAQQIMDGAHFLSAGIVSFARGLNDTPKIVAMLLLLKWMDVRWGFFAVAATMALGGLLNARRVAETMSHKITPMNHGQGFSANLTTGILVILASVFGLPVSTTHVSVGALFGMGVVTGQANPRVMLNIVLSWLITLPCAALIAGVTYALLKNL